MMSSLEKLKALNSRLENQIEHKQKIRSLVKSEDEKPLFVTPQPKVEKEFKPPLELNLTPLFKKEFLQEVQEEPIKKPIIEEKKEVREEIKEIKEEAPINIIAIHGENTREVNHQKVRELYNELQIFEKAPDFDNIFIYKAMNLSGIGLKEEDFGEVREGKYIQIIAITYEPDREGKKKAKNISLGYFGKAETLEDGLKNKIIEFVLRWRYEKAFQNVEHYKDLIAKVESPLLITVH